MVIPAGTPELPRSDLVAPTWLVHCACRQNIRHVPPPGLMTILFAWRKTGDRVSAVIVASGFEGVHCLCFFTASLYPNTSKSSGAWG